MPFATPSQAVELTVGGTNRFVTCWKIERLDAVTLYFTAYCRPLVIDGVTYEPAVAELTAQQSVEDGSGNTMEQRGAISSEMLEDDDIAAGRYRGAKITEFRVDWMFPFAGKLRSAVYYITDTEHDAERWKASIAGVAYRLARRRGHTATIKCNVTRFGDARCGLDVTSFTQTGRQVLSITKENRSFTHDATGDLGLLEFGELTWTVGANAGMRNEVKSHTSAGISLRFRTVNPIAVGDEFTVVRGCDRLPETCQAYGNILNFRGEPFLRGSKALYSTP